MPNGPLTLLQIVIGIIDLGFCSLAMYVLVPNHPDLGFVTVAVMFVSATLLGFASHSPGGLGVFDAAMLIALWQYDKEDLLAGLLIFRLLYYITPFALALLTLGMRELRLQHAEAARCRRPMMAAAPGVGWPAGSARRAGQLVGAVGRRRPTKRRHTAPSRSSRRSSPVCPIR